MIAANRHILVAFAAALLLAPLAALRSADPQPRVFHAQGELAGEVTQTTVILQSRLTATSGLEGDDVPGAAGWGRSEYAESADFAGARQTEWIQAKPDNDYIVRKQLRGLNPSRTYHYRLVFGADRSRAEAGPVRKFKTFPAADQPAPVRFVVGNCMNYALTATAVPAALQPSSASEERR